MHQQTKLREKKVEFYQILQYQIDHVPNLILIVMGDMNAVVCTKNKGFEIGHQDMGELNENREYSLSL